VKTLRLDEILAHYHQNYADVPGFFLLESQAIWDFFLRAQADLGVNGDFLEIGVYKGKSAILGALHLREGEAAVLVDLNPVPETRAVLEKVRPGANVYLECPSTEAAFNREITARAGRFRWCHVDGDHTGYSALHDIRLCASVLAPKGILVVDDFFNFRYPQLTASVYRFLFDHPIEWKMVFAGANKAYLCRAAHYRTYEAIIRKDLITLCKQHDLTLCKSSYASDWGSYSATPTYGGPAFIGMDDRPQDGLEDAVY
jgi:hypothetical protein